MEVAGEIREWIKFLAIVGGIILAGKTYLDNLRQRRLENSFKAIEFFHRHIKDETIDRWKDVYHGIKDASGDMLATCDLDGKEFLWDDLIGSSGPPDSGAVERLCEQFDLIGGQVLNRTVDRRMINFEFAQMMDSVHDIMVEIDRGSPSVPMSLLFSRFNEAIVVLRKESKGRWPYREYVRPFNEV